MTHQYFLNVFDELTSFSDILGKGEQGYVQDIPHTNYQGVVFIGNHWPICATAEDIAIYSKKADALMPETGLVHFCRSLSRESYWYWLSQQQLGLLCRVIWACKEDFGLCLELHLLDERLFPLSPRNVKHLLQKRHLLTPMFEDPCITVTSGWSAVFIYGQGLPTSSCLRANLHITFRQYPKAKALKTCRCLHSSSSNWMNKQGISLCAKLLCPGGPFQDVHVFFEDRHVPFQVAGLLSRYSEEYR